MVAVDMDIHGYLSVYISRDCNPELEFSIPGFGIVEFPIPGSRRDWRSIVKTTKIATWGYGIPVDF